MSQQEANNSLSIASKIFEGKESEQQCKQKLFDHTTQFFDNVFEGTGCEVNVDRYTSSTYCGDIKSISITVPTEKSLTNFWKGKDNIKLITHMHLSFTGHVYFEERNVIPNSVKWSLRFDSLEESSEYLFKRILDRLPEDIQNQIEKTFQQKQNDNNSLNLK